jgi:DNA-binding XRE family transcriptional regulator
MYKMSLSPLQNEYQSSFLNNQKPKNMRLQNSALNDNLLFAEFYKRIKENSWLEAEKLLWKVLKDLKAIVEKIKTDKLSEDANQAIKNVVRCGAYFDVLNDSRFKWLDDYARQVYIKLVKSPAEADIEKLHLALNFVRFEFRRKYLGFEYCHQMIEEVAKIGENTVGFNADNVKINSFWSRLNYIRYEIALKTQERFEAEKYLDLADSFLTLQAQTQAKINAEKARSVLYLKTARVAMSRVFLWISSGRYEHAFNLQTLLDPTIDKDKDPRANLRSVIANSIIRRCLCANDKLELKLISRQIELELNRFKKIVPYLILRLQYEHCLTILLRIGIEPDQKWNLIKKLHELISKIAPKREGDPVWEAQIKILQARIKLHEVERETETTSARTKFKAAEDEATAAINIIENTPFRLLKIEARIAKAVVLLRQDEDEKYKEAINLLHEAVELNRTKDLISSDTEFTQPELAALCALYLARIYIRKKDRTNAVKSLDDYQAVSTKVEHAWILERLAPEIQKEVLLAFISDVNQQHTYNLTEQTHIARKRAIEKASAELQTSRLTAIAQKLDISPQKLSGWLHELKDARFYVELYNQANATEPISIKREQLIFQKEEIERASRILSTTKKAKIADFLGISRQTLYNRLSQLEKTGYMPSLS